MNDPFLMKIEEYLDEALAPEDAVEMEVHLENCAECRAEIEACRRIRNLAQDAEPVEIPGDLGPAIRSVRGPWLAS